MTQLTTTTVSAIVYPDRARLVRQGGLSLTAGVHSLEIEKLPLSSIPIHCVCQLTALPAPACWVPR